MVKKFAGISLENKIIMGVLNLSPETFYEGSLAKNSEEAAKRAEKMVKNGAQIIDIGGMSTGPSVEPISVNDEKELLLPAVEAIRKRVDSPISVDTQRAEVAKESLELGADIINEVSGFKADEKMPKIADDYDCSAVLMANRVPGRIRTAEKEREDINNMEKIKEGLRESLQICEEHGVDLDKVAIDPAIGFGKGAKNDLRVLANLESLEDLNQPVCIGVSRKSFIGKTLGLDEPADRLYGSLGAAAAAVFKEADIIRTHDPKETVQLVRMIEAVQQKEGG